MDHVTINMSNVAALHGKLSHKLSNGTMYKNVPTDDFEHHSCNGADKILKGYSDPKDSIQGRNLPDLPSSSEMQGICLPSVVRFPWRLLPSPCVSMAYTPSLGLWCEAAFL